MSNDGATVDPLAAKEAEAAKQECPGAGDGRRFAHKWEWMPTHGNVSFESQCVRCGATKTTKQEK